MKCHIISVGSELLNGMMIDTNSIFMAEELNKYGVEIAGKSVVGDKIDDIVKTIEFAKKNSDIVIMTGGLGPTIDDLTRDAISKYTGKELILYDEEFIKMKEKFAVYKIDMPERNIRQVMFPEGSEIIENKKGSAQSFYIEDIAAFPGVPEEVRDSFPRFCEKLSIDRGLNSKIYIKDILVWGIPESQLEEKILDIVENEKEVFVEFLVKNYGIIIRLLVDENKKERAEKIKSDIYMRIQDYIFGEDSDRLENLLVEEIAKREYTISTAESCTGGMIAQKIVGVSGVSKVFTEGFITYSNESKISVLGVKKETIDKYGAVSKETVLEMLAGLKTDTGIAISGIAGPDGGTTEKPVGTVVIGIKIKDMYMADTFLIRGDRDRIRERSAMSAIHLLFTELKKST